VAVHSYGAEDFSHRLNWKYALTNVTFATNTFAYILDYMDDADGNGIPDWWEKLLMDGKAIAGSDSDGDGLNNLYEYLADTNPKDRDTDHDGIWDGAEDADGDGLSNAREQSLGSHPLLTDTDDDGVPDASDIGPADSLNPLVDRVLQLDGAASSYVEMPRDNRFSLADWTIQAW